MSIEYEPIGIIHTPFTDLEGMPIQPAGASGGKGTVEILPEYAEGLADLDGFSHIVLLYHFHRSTGFKLRVTPFLDDQPRGLFATRAPKRPNPIGLSVVKLVKVEGPVVRVENVDVLDGTPLLDRAALGLLVLGALALWRRWRDWRCILLGLGIIFGVAALAAISPLGWGQYRRSIVALPMVFATIGLGAGVDVELLELLWSGADGATIANSLASDGITHIAMDMVYTSLNLTPELSGEEMERWREFAACRLEPVVASDRFVLLRLVP